MEDDGEQFLVTLGLAVVLPVGVCLSYFLFAPKMEAYGLVLYFGTRPHDLVIANDVLSFLLAFSCVVTGTNYTRTFLPLQHLNGVYLQSHDLCLSFDFV